jgi:hypothetical protein
VKSQLRWEREIGYRRSDIGRLRGTQEGTVYRALLEQEEGRTAENTEKREGIFGTGELAGDEILVK